MHFLSSESGGGVGDWDKNINASHKKREPKVY